MADSLFHRPVWLTRTTVTRHGGLFHARQVCGDETCYWRGEHEAMLAEGYRPCPRCFSWLAEAEAPHA